MGIVQTIPINNAKIVAFEPLQRLAGVPYERYQRNTVLSGRAFALGIIGIDKSNVGQGARRVLDAPVYEVVDEAGRVLAVASVAAGAKSVTAVIDSTAMPDGWQQITPRASMSAESMMPMWVCVKNGAASEDTITPVQQGEYERLVRSNPGVLAWVKAPGRYAPTPRPLAKRTYEPIPTVPKRDQLHCEYLVPVRFGDMHRPNKAASGIVSSFDTQAYTWSGLHGRYPTVALLDGPRGVGSTPYVTHAVESTAVVDGVLRRTVYFTDPWRAGKISEEGHVTTLVGYRHKGIPGHWEDGGDLAARNLELVGDWSAVPPERRGFWEAWELAFDLRTTGTDPKLPLVPNDAAGGALQAQHPGNIVAFVADTQWNRICRVEFDRLSHSTPARVTEFITNLPDAWSCNCVEGVLYVTARKAHRISAYNATTGAFLHHVQEGHLPQVGTFTCTAGSDLVAISPVPTINTTLYLNSENGGTESFEQYTVVGVALDKVRVCRQPGSVANFKAKISDSGKVYKPLAYIDQNREVIMPSTLAERRASPVCAPEGLFFQDGWLYFTSKAQAEVRRVRRDGTGLEVVRPVRIDGNSKFAKLALGDGTWAPRGTTATWTWSNAHFGGPEVVAPDGTAITLWYSLPMGGSGDWTVHSGYGTAGFISNGRLVNFNMLDGCYEVRRRLPGDRVETPAVVAGRAEYYARYLYLLHGPDGFGFYGQPLPWGLTANIDAYLVFCGHRKPA
jgi:hypothetical protein